jgi:hypothetical protein
MIEVRSERVNRVRAAARNGPAVLKRLVRVMNDQINMSCDDRTLDALLNRAERLVHSPSKGLGGYAHDLEEQLMRAQLAHQRGGSVKRRALIHDVDDVPPTPEQVAGREKYERRREQQRVEAERQARQEDRAQAMEDALRRGVPTARMERARRRLSDLAVLGHGRWIPGGSGEWSAETADIEREITKAIRASVAAVIQPKIDEVQAELASATAERDEMLRRLPRR